VTAAEPSRSDLIHRAIWLERVTAGSMDVDRGGRRIGSGVLACSLSLIAFGADSLIELASAGVVLWRLNFELREGTGFSESVERRASRIAGGLAPAFRRSTAL